MIDSAAPAPGMFSYTWAITMAGASATCAAVGADRFVAVETPVVGQAFADRFLCSDMAGVSFGLAPSQYTLELVLMDSKGTPDTSDDVTVKMLPAVQVNLPAGATEVVPLATFAF
jgi:hypothetical protein